MRQKVLVLEKELTKLRLDADEVESDVNGKVLRHAEGIAINTHAMKSRVDRSELD